MQRLQNGPAGHQAPEKFRLPQPEKARTDRQPRVRWIVLLGVRPPAHRPSVLVGRTKGGQEGSCGTAGKEIGTTTTLVKMFLENDFK